MTTLAFVLLAFAQAPQEPPTFAAGVESVYLDVSVRRDGKPVVGLTAADFELSEAGASRAVEVVEGANAPVHAILALDVSSSVQGPRLEALRAAARAFLDGLSPSDRATLVTFSHRVQLQTTVGATPAEARVALDRAQPGGSTSLFDGAFAALALADRRHGRPVVLLFSDGDDELSWLDAERLRELSREAEGVVHAVAVTALPPNSRESLRVDLDDRGREARERGGVTAAGALSTTSTGFGGRGGMSDSQRVFDAQSRASSQLAKAAKVPEALTALAAESGGEVWRADEGSLGPAFAAALADVRSRYVLRFEPSGGKPHEWREVKVRVKGGRGEVRGRRGFRVR